MSGVTQASLMPLYPSLSSTLRAGVGCIRDVVDASFGEGILNFVETCETFWHFRWMSIFVKFYMLMFCLFSPIFYHAKYFDSISLASHCSC